VINQLIIDALASLNYPVILQGSYAPEVEIPDTFITFQTLTSDTQESFDNEEALTAWEINITIYSRDPEILSQLATSTRDLLKAAEFIPQGKGFDMISNEAGFLGWGTNYKYLTKENII